MTNLQIRHHCPALGQVVLNTEVAHTASVLEVDPFNKFRKLLLFEDEALPNTVIWEARCPI